MIKWSISQMVESVNYGITDPVRPWQGTVIGKFIYSNPNDFDPNSYAMAREVFDTEEEAEIAYISACISAIDTYEERIEQLKREIEFYEHKSDR